MQIVTGSRLKQSGMFWTFDGGHGEPLEGPWRRIISYFYVAHPAGEAVEWVPRER
jgi:hypothetical protein